MSRNAYSSQGVTFEYSLSPVEPFAFTAVPDIRSITGPTGSATVIDVTDLNSVAREKLMGLMDEGQVSIDINYRADNSAHNALRSARASKTLCAFRITFTDSGNATYQWTGYVTGFSVTNAVDTTTKATVTIEISGAITFTA